MSIKRGVFVVLEGLDRSGKSSQVKRTIDYFKNRNLPVVGMEFPDRVTTPGKAIDSYLKEKENLNDQNIHLLYCVNRWEKKYNLII